MFGLEGRKGVVAVGADADLVVYDPAAEHTISAKTHHMDVDYSCYEGRTVAGKAEIVLSRGKVIVDGDEWLGAPGDGRFLKRSPTGELLART
jgi:dihydropyrimidinase